MSRVVVTSSGPILCIGGNRWLRTTSLSSSLSSLFSYKSSSHTAQHSRSPFIALPQPRTHPPTPTTALSKASRPTTRPPPCDSLKVRLRSAEPRCSTHTNPKSSRYEHSSHCDRNWCECWPCGHVCAYSLGSTCGSCSSWHITAVPECMR